MKWLVFLWLIGCTKPNPGVCCENELECSRLGLSADDVRPCNQGVCVANACVAQGCDGDEDCSDSTRPFCVVGACSAGCDGDEDCLDPDLPRCLDNVCSVDCEARGGRIVFQSNRDGDDDLFVSFADGFGATSIMPTSSNEGEARWSPDGRKLAYLGDDDGDVDVYVIDETDPRPLKLSENSSEDLELEWSPDGMRLAFTTRASALQTETVAIDGTDHRRLQLAVEQIAFASWAPDSTNVVMLAGSSPAMPPRLNVFTQPFNNGTSHDLTSAGLVSEPARWSPDGSRVALVEADSGRRVRTALQVTS